MGPFTCDLVIAYYKENLDWLKKFESFPFRCIYIYTKGKHPIMPFHHNNVKIIKLHNIGRCDHTYIRHIHNHYSDLPDVTIFSTGSAHLPHKDGNIRFIVPKVFESKTSVFRVESEPEHFKEFKDFKMDSWQSTDTDNQEQPTKDKLYPSNIRPFGKWYKTLFPDIVVKHVAYGGVFAVSRAHIHHRNKGFYKDLLAQFPKHSNPEIGHYFERAWLAIFHPIPPECIFIEGENLPPSETDIIKFGKTLTHKGGRRRTYRAHKNMRRAATRHK